ncbi:MAG: dockerin type I domain-containing protein [Nitrospinales bacterium]
MFRDLLLITMTLISSVWIKADITLSVDDLDVNIFATRSYTIGEIFHKQRLVCDQLSNQGTVLQIDGVFCGSGHGSEEVLEVKLQVDGVPVEVEEDVSYKGVKIELYRRTVIGNAYILNSHLLVSADRIEETVDLQAYDAQKNCNIFYGIQGSRVNRFDEYASFDLSGNQIDSGVTKNNNNKTVNLAPAAAVAQYDPITYEGILTAMVNGAEDRLEYFIWDRPKDNKLYASFTNPIGSCSLEKAYHFRQLMIFFEASPEESETVPQDIIANFCRREILGDVNGDCHVNLADMAIVSDHWLYSGYDDFRIPQDLNDDRSVDVIDLMIIANQWLQSGVGLSGDIAPYPDGDGTVNLLDFEYLARKWLEKY